MCFGRQDRFFSSLISRDYSGQKNGNIELSQNRFANDEEFRPFAYGTYVAVTDRRKRDEAEIGEE